MRLPIYAALPMHSQATDANLPTTAVSSNTVSSSTLHFMALKSWSLHPTTVLWKNFTLELPQRDKIDESWLPEAEYFAELGELVSGQPAWGLISGALGSKARRNKFVDRYFYGQLPFGSEDKAAAEVEDETEVEPDEEVDNIVEALFSAPSAETATSPHPE